MSARPLTRGIVVGYGLPGLVTAIPIIPIAIVLPSYFAIDLGLGLTATGIALGVARIVDFFSDLIIGVGVDRVHWRRDSRRLSFKPWIAIGALTAAIALYKLPHPESSASAVFLGIWSSILFVGWTFMMVPYTAWGAVLSNNQHVRSQLAVSREVAGLFGMLIALSAPLIFSFATTPLALMFWLSLFLGVPALSYTLLKIPESIASVDTPTQQIANAKINFSEITDLFRFRPFRNTVTCWFLNSLASGLPAVLFPIVAQQYFQFSERELFVLLFIYFGAGICASPIWLTIAKRVGKIAAWQMAIGLNIAAFMLVLTIDPAASGIFSSDLFYLVCAFTGLSLAADLALPASIQADVMAADRDDNHKQRLGSAFAVWSMTSKLALGIAIMIGFVSLGASVDDLDNMSNRDELNLMLLYVCVPCLVKVFALGMLSRIKLNNVLVLSPNAN